MEWQTGFNLFGSAVMCGIGWFANTIWTAHKELRKELSEHRVEVAKLYAPRAELAQAMIEIRGLLQRIEDKLDRKADK